MKFWIDAQLSLQLAPWIAERFSVEAIAVRDIGLRDAVDQVIFNAARLAQAIVITKDRDFVEMVERLGIPPQVVWITCGNTSNARLRILLEATFAQAVQLLETGEPLVEISNIPGY
jgi:predicted nuclease of predicted toxin-antitoxin system